MKLIYKPGVYPTPMLAYYTEKSEEAFNGIKEESTSKITNNSEFCNQYNHIFNMNAYIIYNDDNKVTAFVFNSFAYIIYLLRVINKNLVFEIDNKDKDVFINEIKDFLGEFEII